MSIPSHAHKGRNMTQTVLSQWLKGIRIKQIAHVRAATRYVRVNRLIGLPVTVLSVAAGTSVFATLASTEKKWVLVCVGVVTMATAILSGLQTFLNYGELSAKHQAASSKYGRLRRRIEEAMVAEPQGKELAGLLQEVREAWDRLDEEAPLVPQGDYDNAARKLGAGAGATDPPGPIVPGPTTKP